MPSVGIIGTGTMGAGIAQVAALAGWTAELLDVSEQVAAGAAAGVRRQLDRLVEKGKLSPAARDAAAARLVVAGGPRALSGCELVIEAVVENLDAKCRVLRDLRANLPPDTILATNTSSLSVGAIGQGCGAPQMTVGMHFFNPVPLMPLVEIIAGERTAGPVVQRAAEIARLWGKTVVHAKDTPGFIVNRVARGYYLESLRMLGEGIAGVDEIDRTMRSLGGFRMGPFELMDLIGIDVNYTVSVSVYEQLGRPARLAPHPLQRELLDAGRLGRKTQRGFYLYGEEGAAPMPAVAVDRRSFHVPPTLYEFVRRFNEKAAREIGSATEQYVYARVLAVVMNEAALLADERGATPEDIDTAMRLATGYPHGPLEWAEQTGRHTVAGLLRALNESVEDRRFAPAAWFA